MRNDSMVDNETLFFIQPHVLERLVTGKFVAKRAQNKGYKVHERRDLLSPLNVTRRAIRYEPLVFSNRRETIIQTVEEINTSHVKLLLVSGPSGRGKTSFIRGIVEMMGGGKEQLLWFDVSKHTDFDEVIRFLIDFMTYIFRNYENPQDIPDNPNPIATLELLLRQAADFPILIVIDNMEYLVAPDQTIRSRELKEAFNFLLSFPNVKLVLSGKILPFADMNPAAAAVCHLTLNPLDAEKSELLVKDILRTQALKEQDLQPLTRFFHGEPYLLFLFAMLFDRHPDAEGWFEELTRAHGQPERALLYYLFQRLSPTESRILKILSLIRHGATPSGLQAIINYCEPHLTDFNFRQLDQSFIRLLLKKVYPPQMVLNKLRNRNKQQQEGEESEGSDSIEAYYQLSEIFIDIIQQGLTDEELSAYHERLQQFYLAEKNKHILERVYQARIQHLVAEAQYHFNKIRRKRASVGEPIATDPDRPLEFNTSDRTRTLSPFDYSTPPLPASAAEIARAPEPMTPSQVAPAEESEESDDLPDLADTGDEDLESPPVNDPPAVAPIGGPKRTPTASPMTMPIAIQVEPSIAQPLRLTDDDLKRLAELITATSGTPSASPTLPYRSPAPAAEEPSTVEDSLSTEVSPAETDVETTSPMFDDLALVEDDPNEQRVQARLKEAIELHDVTRIAQELLFLAGYRQEKGMLHNAESCLLKAMEFAHGLNNHVLQLQLNAALGHLYQVQFQHNKALRHLREVEHLYETSPMQDAMDKETVCVSYEDMAEIYFYRKEFREALSCYQKCLALNPGDKVFRADMLFRLALAFDEARQPKAAIKYYLQSYRLQSALKDDPACAATLYNLASLYFEYGRWAEAHETLTRCLVYDRRIGAAKDIFRSLMLLSRLGEAQHHLAMAQEHAREAYTLAQQASDYTNMATACLRLGHLAELTHSWRQAEQYYHEAQAIAADTLSEDSRQLIQQKLASIQEHLS